MALKGAPRYVKTIAANVEVVQGPHSSDMGGYLERMVDTTTGKIISSTTITGVPQALVVSVADFGAVGDGVTDNTQPIQAALNATPPGGTTWVPAVGAGFSYKFSTLTIPAGVTLAGGGWDWQRSPALGLFGSSGWTTPANFSGSVMVSSATSGTAITQSMATPRRGGISGVLVLGPGTGSSVGVALSGVAPIDSRYLDLGIANFATGMTRSNVENCSFTNLTIAGCTTGLSDGTATNQNIHIRLAIYFCATGQTFSDATCLANLFLSSVFQNTSGQSLTIAGRHNVWLNPYFENSTSTGAVSFSASATDCAVLNPDVEGSNIVADALVGFLSGSVNCWFGPYINNSTPLTILNNGTGNHITGNLTNYSGSDTAADLIDDPNNRQTMPRQINSGLTMATGFLVTTSSGITANRPTLLRRTGSMWYDASLGKPIFWDGGSNWRDSAGNIV